MELQFEKQELGCMQMLKCRVQNAEETAEIRLDDTMAPADKVICAWGQVLLRGKQWRSDAVQITGGVMAWVMYAAQDGTSQCVQTWVPLQIKADIPPSERDGVVMANLLLRGVDARCIHERKLLVRVDVATQLQCGVPWVGAMYGPKDIPQNVQLKMKTHSVCLPMEMGEKAFAIDEILSLPASGPALESVVCFRLQPELIDRKVMADKVVFRGVALLHLLYKAMDGQLCSWDFELPFSQYAELSGQYEQTATTKIVPLVTSLELEREPDGRFHLKAGLVGQYLIYDQRELPVVEDAYCTRCKVQLQSQQLQWPVITQVQTQNQRCEVTQPCETGRVLDVMFLPDQPTLMRTENGQELELSGKFQMLWATQDGEMITTIYPWNGQLPIGNSDGGMPESCVALSGMPTASVAGGNVMLRTDMNLETACVADQAVSMICGLQLEEQENGERPAVVLRRAGNGDLWKLAKTAGSTVDAIVAANGLTGDPEPDRLLLIPTV